MFFTNIVSKTCVDIEKNIFISITEHYPDNKKYVHSLTLLHYINIIILCDPT